MNPGTTVLYNGNSLQTTNIITNGIAHYDSPVVDAKSYSVAHANASAVPFTSYPNKVITLSGQLWVSTGVNTMDALIDTFKGYLTAQNANLDIGYNGGTRRYNVLVVNKTTITRPNDYIGAKFSIDFFCQPFGMDTSTTTVVSATGRTLATYTDSSYTFLGNAPYQLPIYTVTYSAIGSAPVSGTVSIGNNTNGQQINVTRTWSATDVLVIDTTKKIVTVNGIAVNFTGAFPVFPPGTSSIGYSDSFTSRTFNYSVVYTKLYF
jgi:phage-related protein